ncbi:MAG: hypothetical protein KBG72_07805 [Agrobacterium sp.]|nr:hypothetical protein [Agrobacterium sp.]
MRHTASILALSFALTSPTAAQNVDGNIVPSTVQAELPQQRQQMEQQEEQPQTNQGKRQYPGVDPERFQASGDAQDGASSRQPRRTETRRASSVPIIGAKRLLNSLDELNRPLTPEEVTAYGSTVQMSMPMTPEMIRDYRRRVDESQKAAAMPATGFRAQPINDAVRVSLAAGQPLQSLYVTPNTVSVMAFYDKTGKAWPVASYVVGRSDSFQVFALQEGSNQIAVTPLVNHGYSNIVVSLVEEDRPIVINLETNDTKTNFRRDITIEGYGPNAKRNPTPVLAKASPSDGIMMAFAHGAALPQGAVRLTTSDEGVEAWSYQGQLYVRTADAVQTPSPNQALSAPGGIHAYRLKLTPMVLINRNGSVMNVRITR